MTADLPTHPSTEAVGEVRREQLAAIEHVRWAHWQEWMHDQGARTDDGSLWLPAELVQRWERQIRTKYEDLSEEEKRSDREQVDRYWPLIVAEFEKLRSDLSAMTSDRDWLRTEFERVTAEAEELGGLVLELIDDDECAYDHHSYCQTHNLHSAPCPHARAKALFLDDDKED